MICSRCKKDKPNTEFYRERCRIAKVRGWIRFTLQCDDCIHEVQRKRMDLRREEVIRHYSNGTMSCACCNEAERKFLTVDHINGKQDLRDTGYSLVLRLIREKFPVGYQVLCFNCNCAKGFFGICPHQERMIVDKIIEESQ